MLLVLLLYIGSFMLINKFRRRDREDLYSTDYDEILVYRIRYVHSPIFSLADSNNQKKIIFQLVAVYTLFSSCDWSCPTVTIFNSKQWSFVIVSE